MARHRRIDSVYPLTPTQEGMLFHALNAPGSGIYCVQIAYTIDTALDLAAFAAAWRAVFERHEVLRSVFSRAGGGWSQVVLHDVAAPFAACDLRALSGRQQQIVLDRYRAWDRQRGFELTRAPLMRFALFRTGDSRFESIWTFHHALIDGWSAALVLGDVVERYGAIRRGTQSPAASPTPTPAPAPYASYVSWLQQRDSRDAQAFWARELDGFLEPTPLPLARRGPATSESGWAEESIELTPALSQSLSRMARAQRVTLSAVMQGAWALLLARYAGSRDILFGLTVSGRPPFLPHADLIVGMLINTVPVRIRQAAGEGVGSWLRAIQQRRAEAQAHEHASLADIQRWSGIGRGRTLFESVVVFENYPLDQLETAYARELDTAAPLEPHNVRTWDKANYPLGLVVSPGATLGLRIPYEPSRFTADAVRRLLAQVCVILEAFAADPDQPLDAVDLTTPAERAQLAITWNQPFASRTDAVAAPAAARDVDVPVAAAAAADAECIHTRFQAQAARTPDAIALMHGDAQLTYATLDARTNRLGRHLREMGVGPDVRVGICIERGPDQIVAMLAVLKAGGAYVPLDPVHPPDRLAFMLEDAGAPVLLTEQHLLDRFLGSGAIVISLDADWPRVTADDAPLPVITAPLHLAYIVYTSGSTGTPKGVAVTHAGLCNLADAQIAAFQVYPQSAVLQFASMGFDAAASEWTTALLSGARLVTIDQAQAIDADALVHAMVRAAVDVATLPPTWLAGVDARLPALRTLVTAGEACPPAVASRWSRGRRMLNAYGPTECTVCATISDPLAGGRQEPDSVSRDVQDPDSVPIGRPMANVQVYVLDDTGALAPMGAVGELYVSGSGVARGYINRPDLTAERFLPVTVAGAAPGARWYRTGDRVRWEADGQLTFLGRRDNQIKLRGYRIELGEIEAAIAGEAGVGQVVVHVRTDGPVQQLVAYLTAAPGRTVDVSIVQAAVRRRLPDYMVPNAWVVLPQMPMTANGKIDRRALPAPTMMAGSGGEPPRTPEEEIVANIWAEVLHIDRVTRTADFFELGGHSLLATQVLSRVRDAFGVDLPFAALFEHPTIVELAEQIQQARRADRPTPLPPPIAAVPRTGALPLSFAQERLWFLQRMNPTTAAYNGWSALRLDGPLDRDALARALAEIVRRHQALRTVFADVDGTPVQTIAPFAGFTLSVDDLTGEAASISAAFASSAAAAASPAASASMSAPAPDSDRAWQTRAAAFVAIPFDLATGPLFRAMLLRLDEQAHVLLLCMHHIITDEWSMDVFFRELATLYEACEAGVDAPLRELPLQYADYAAWQRAQMDDEAAAAQLAYWTRQLAGIPARLELPVDHPPPATPTLRGAIEPISIPRDLLDRLQALAQREAATLFMVLASALNVLLSRYAQGDDIVIGSPVTGRTRRELEPLIGFFVNVLVLRTDLSGAPTFSDVIRRVRQATLDAYEHQDVPFERLVEALQPDRGVSQLPLLQVSFTLHTLDESTRSFAGLTVTPLDLPVQTAKLDLAFNVTSTAQGLTGGVTYSTDLFEAATIRRLTAQFAHLLAQVATDADRPIADLDLLPARERERLLEEWSGARNVVELAPDHTIIDLFESHARATPAAPAIRFNGETTTYGDLNERANRIAHFLIQLGVGPEVRVGLCLPRGLSTIVSILGVLKAGGAYVPLDPDYPRDRLAFMLTDARIAILLTEDALIDSVPATDAIVLSLDRAADDIASQSIENPPRRATTETLAYVIYTSGSTGLPKGVMVTHRGIPNLARAQARSFRIDRDSRVLQFASCSFDATISEMFVTLAAGATLVIAPSAEMLPGDALVQTLRRERVSAVTLPPSVAAVLPPEDLPDLKTLICAGEALTPAIVNRWSRDGRAIVNAYGPTEMTVCASLCACEPDGRTPAIGQPLDNIRAFVLDSDGALVPPGVPGELCVGGVGLARGYLCAPAQTATKFVPDPFGPAGARLYRTGDRVRWRADGLLEFLGRVDRQVKLRGFRIEPEEVERVLIAYPEVRDARVIVREDAGDKRLVAYVVTHPAAELWPSLGEYPVYDDLIYAGLAEDARRMASYRAGLARVVRDRVVIDVGTGARAVLARMCVEAGARKVYAIELFADAAAAARRRIAEAGLQDRIEVIEGDVRTLRLQASADADVGVHVGTVRLPEPADVCVSEIVESIAGAEGAAVLLEAARRLMTPDGIFVPRRCVTHVAGVSLPGTLHAAPAFTGTAAHYVDRIFAAVGHRFDVRLCIKDFPADHLLTDRAIFEDLDFSEPVTPDYDIARALTVTRAGRLDGLLLWLRLDVDAHEQLDILQDRTAWYPAFFPIFYPGIDVEPGDRLSLRCRSRLSFDGVHPDYEVEGVLERGSERLPFHYRSPHHDADGYCGNAFHARLFDTRGHIAAHDASSSSRAVGTTLRTRLAERLPDYLVPAAVVAIDRMPLNANGKLDVDALPAPDYRAPDARVVPPRTATEEMLAGIFADVLRLDRVGVTDDFFDLGGHSLLVTQVVSRIRDAFGVELPLRAAFDAPTVAGLAALIASSDASAQAIAAPPLTRGSDAEPAPLSPAQRRLWFVDQLEPGSPLYNMGIALRTPDDLDRTVLARALTEIARRHAVLRTALTSGASGGDPVQVVSPPTPVLVPLIDLTALRESQATRIAHRLVAADGREPFDLGRAPLWRARLIALARQQHLLLITMHHAISDGWSIDILTRELSQLYDAFAQQQRSPLPPLPIQYADYARWQHAQWHGDRDIADPASGATPDTHVAWWRRQLTDLPPSPLPFDFKRPVGGTRPGGIVDIDLPPTLASELEPFSRREGVTLFMVLLAAFQVLLARVTGEDDIVIGTDAANRDRAETAGLIGLFVNQLVLRTDLRGNPSVRELLGRVRTVTLDAYAHQHVPFDRLVQELAPARDGRPPLFQASLSVDRAGDPDADARFTPMSTASPEPAFSLAKLDLTLFVRIAPGTLAAEFSYDTGLFQASTIRRLAAMFPLVLRQMLADPDQRIQSLSLAEPAATPAAARTRVLTA